MYRFSNITSVGTVKKAEMLLFGTIGNKPISDKTEDVFVNGDKFANEMLDLYNSGVNDIDVLINSVGGNVYQGYSIAAIAKTLSDKGANIRMICTGVAYSMAGVILACGKKGNRFAYPHSAGMVHNPSFGGKRPANNPQLKTVTDSLTAMLVESTGIESEKMSELMGKETYFSAQAMEDSGIIDRILPFEKSIDLTNLNQFEQMAACAEINKYEIISKHSNNNVMNKEINAILNLQEEASNSAQVTAIQNLVTRAANVDTLEAKVKTQSEAIENLKAEKIKLEKESKRANAEVLINEAVKAGKITAESKADWIEDAVDNYEKIESRIKGLTVVPGSINDQLDTTDGDKTLAKEYSDMVDNSPEKLDAIEPAKLEKMVAAYNKIEGENIETIIN